jgi:hypothetical protein
MLKNANQDLPSAMQHFMRAAVFFNKVLYGDLAYGKGAGRWQSFYSELAAKLDNSQNLQYENIYAYLRLFITWIYDIHKKNLDEIDQKTSAMKWIVDDRVKLFNAHVPELFDSEPVSNGIIKGFEELVYNENNGKSAEKIYNDLCGRPPAGTARDFAALFTTLFEILKKPEKKFFQVSLSKKAKPILENYHNVPYLSQENNITFQRPDAAPNKLWSPSDPKLLRDIADGLPDVPGESFAKNDLSIPSPWSIFIMNELSLKEPKFAALNKGIYNQWCGLIALLALRKITRYENNGLELKKLEFTTGYTDFLDAVRDTCLPVSYIFDSQDWTQCGCVTLKKKTIAFLANNILICPADSYDAETKALLHKIAPSIVDENGGFLPPDVYFKDQGQSLNRDSKHALSLFLNELKLLITKKAANNKSDIIAALQRKIDGYINDIGRTAPNNKIYIDADINSIENVYDVFEKLCPVSNSPIIELPFVLDETSGGERAALIGLNICGISADSPQAATIFVTENILYNQINTSSIEELKNQKRDDIRLIYDKELLCDSMIMVKKENDAVFPVLPNSSSLADYEIVWPINENLLELYSADTINQMLSAKAGRENITITLTLKLKGKLNVHIISKSYKIMTSESEEKEQASGGAVCIVFDKNRLPFWAVWPYAKVTGADSENTWRRYNYFCVDPVYKNTPVLEVVPFFKNNKDMLSGEQKLSTVCKPIYDIYYRRYSDLPSALKLKEKTGGMPIYKGAVFLTAPKTVQQGAIEWNIGFDFGTTSTTAFYTTNSDSAPRFIQLLTEYNWVAGAKKPETFAVENDMCVLSNSGDRRNLDNYFIDRQCLRQNSYTTTYEIMDTANRAAEHTIFETGRIFWHNYENFKLVNSTEGRRDNILTNIKWETDHSNAGKYLNQMMTQIVYHAAEKGVRKINWFFSYPTAFGLGDKGEFSSTLTMLIESLEKDTGIKLDFNAETNLLTESTAAAFYFRNKNPREAIFLCVDIGGGTSDVSIWTQKGNIFQSSIRFASRDMFIAPLKKLLERKSVMDAVRTNKIEDGIFTMLEYGGKYAKISDDKIKFFIETVLFEYYRDFELRLASLRDNDREAYKKFKYCVFIAYSGLVYYLANIIAELLITDKFEKKIDNEIALIVFGLSGKGSKLTDWINEYCGMIYTEAQNLITEKTKSAANPNGLTITFRNQFSGDAAKTETAIGMVCNLDENGKQKDKTISVDPDMYMGSGIEISNGDTVKSFAKDDFVDIYTDPFFAMPKSLEIRIEQELAEFDDFIDFFNRLAAKTRNEMPPVPKDRRYETKKRILWNQIKTEFKNILGEGRFEPPFVVMLKVFLDECINGQIL